MANGVKRLGNKDFIAGVGIILALFTAIVSAVLAYSKSDAQHAITSTRHAEQIEDLEDETKETAQVLDAVRVKQAKVETQVEQVREDLGEIKQEQREQRAILEQINRKIPSSFNVFKNLGFVLHTPFPLPDLYPPSAYPPRIRPPSITSALPVIHDESSETRKSAALAISSGVPRRFRTICSSTTWAITSSGLGKALVDSQRSGVST